jgi:hypothetical protein
MTKRMKLDVTNRGFARSDFEDLYGSKCSIQESSLATDDAIWLGVHEGSKDYEDKKSVRMHLNREQVASLLPLLNRFVKTGRLLPKKRKSKSKA